MPALGMAQETGTLLRWLKSSGDFVTKGEMLMEVETDKAMVEIEAPASGVLSDVKAQPGDVVPVGHVIARIISTDDLGGMSVGKAQEPLPGVSSDASAKRHEVPRVSPVAARIAQERGVDLAQLKTSRGTIQKQDVLAFLKDQREGLEAEKSRSRSLKTLASPKARRLANEHGLELDAVRGSGPEGAVLAADVLEIVTSTSRHGHSAQELPQGDVTMERLSTVWRVMVERLTNAWTTIPHFYLTREVNATRLTAWRDVQRSKNEKITYTDLLVKLCAIALSRHPRVNAAWQDGQILLHRRINVGLAVAIEHGLVVPVIHDTRELSLKQISQRRVELVERAHAGKLSLDNLSEGTFTISNLGMYGVDAFNAIVNPPQAAILAVSRIAERVVPINHQPAVQPMMTLTLSCDHRVVDGARGAQFLDTLAQLIEEPLNLLD